MYNTTHEFSVSSLRYLDENGVAVKSIPQELNQSELVMKAYEAMQLGRLVDKKAIALQRTGKMGTYPSILGQEAIGAAIGLAMHQEDVLAPYYRDMIAQYLRGVTLAEILLYWGGDERGSAYQRCKKDFPNCVPIATQLCHAAGAAVQMKVQGVHRATVATCGEGATSKGDFLESLNLAGAWQLPLVVVVNNNQWAISTPRSVQTSAETIAQKAIGAGIRGIQVDGNDFFAVYDAVRTALKRAYDGKGATLIEAVTYRLGDHTTADDATRYRKSEELQQAWDAEPLKRMRAFMDAQYDWDDDKEQAMLEALAAKVDAATQEYLETPPEPPTAMFDYLFEEMPTGLQQQRAEVAIRQLAKGGV